MARFCGTISVDRTPEEVFAYLSDFSNVADWEPSVTSARRRGRGRIRTGSVFEVSLGFLGRPLELEYHVTEIESPRRIVFEADADGFRSIDTIRIESRPGGRSRVVYDARIQLQGLRIIFDGALQLAFGVVGNQALRGLRRAFSDETAREPDPVRTN